MADGPEEQLRLAKMLGAYGRLVERERKIIILSYQRLVELTEEITRITDCLYDADDSLDDSLKNMDTANERLHAALFGEVITEDDASIIALTEEDEAAADEAVDESNESDGNDVATVEVAIPLVGP